MKLNELKNKKILILGFGREGKDTYKFLRRLFPNKILGIGDEQENIKLKIQSSKLYEDKKIKWHLGKNYLKSLKNYDLIIKSPGITIHLPEIEKAFKDKKITSQTEIFLENCPGKIIGITGSKGKGTTCSLIYKILKHSGLKVHLVGNIEKPSLHFLSSTDSKDIFVYEISSHQLYNLRKSPHVAVLLNIFPAHLDFFKNFQEYINTKQNITRYQKKSDYFIYNSKDVLVGKIAKTTNAQKIPIIEKSNILKKINKIKIPLIGNHNIQNIAAAITIAKLFKISDKDILESIKNFKPLPHRLEFIGIYKGIKFYNDSAATLPKPTIWALESLGKNVQTIFLGGHETNVDYSELEEKILKSKIKTIILFPPNGRKILKEIENKKNNENNEKLKCFLVKNMKDAVKLAYQYTDKNKICLLSCASPSFGLFKNYKQRGNLFKKYIKLEGKNIT